jgi:hypothetical protein
MRGRVHSIGGSLISGPCLPSPAYAAITRSAHFENLGWHSGWLARREGTATTNWRFYSKRNSNQQVLMIESLVQCLNPKKLVLFQKFTNPGELLGLAFPTITLSPEKVKRVQHEAEHRESKKSKPPRRIRKGEKKMLKQLRIMGHKNWLLSVLVVAAVGSGPMASAKFQVATQAGSIDQLPSSYVPCPPWGCGWPGPPHCGTPGNPCPK